MEGIFLGNVEEADADGAEGLRPGAGALIHLAVAVLDVAQHRLAQIGQMSAYLMSAAGDEADAAEGEGASRPQHVHIGDDLLAALVLGLVGVDAHLIVLLVVLPPCSEAPALGS